MPRLTNRNPSYRRHRASGQAVVTLNGQDVYLGPWNSAASKREYDRVIGEYLARGREVAVSQDSYTVAMLILAFWKDGQVHYRGPDGKPTSEVDNFRDVLKPLRRLYGDKPAASFGPLSLKALRGEMIKLGWCGTNINRQISQIRHVFKWGVENELIPASVHQGLAAVAGLRAGRSEASESEPVKPGQRTIKHDGRAWEFRLVHVGIYRLVRGDIQHHREKPYDKCSRDITRKYRRIFGGFGVRSLRIGWL